MLKDRQLLEQNISDVLDEIKHKRKLVHEISDELAEYRVLPGTLNDIISDKERISSVHKGLLCLLCVAMYNATKEERLTPSVFFTATELTEAKNNYSESLFTPIALPYTFKPVLQRDYENYLTIIDASVLNKFNQSMLIIYDYNTQRSPKYKKIKDSIVLSPDVDKKNVNEISGLILKGTYFADPMTLNVYSDEQEPVSYNPKTLELTIHENSVISILDGFHRLEAISKALSIDPDIDIKFELLIKIFDTETAKRYFGQINTRSNISRSRIEELRAERGSDQVVRELQRKSDLKGKIASSPKILSISGHLTSYSVLADSIHQYFPTHSFIESKEVSEYLTDFFNYLLGSFPDVFLNQDKHRTDSYMNHPLMFAAYVRIAKHFRDHDLKLSKLKEFIENIDFSSEELKEILTPQRIRTSMTRTKLVKYIEKYFN